MLDGALRTPPASAGCLLGVTRALLLELAADLGIDASETDVPMGALANVDEAFLSSTTREVQTITAIDDRPVREPHAADAVAPRLAVAFRDLVGRDLDP